MNTLTLNLDHLSHNYRIIRNRLDPKTQLIAVVKAHAYGMNHNFFVQRLVDLGVDALAVAYTEEGKELRKLGVKIPILVFYPQKNTFLELIYANLEPCLYSKDVLKSFKEELISTGNDSYPIHIKYNTGLNRIGFSPEEVSWVLENLEPSCFKLKSVYSHLAVSEEQRPSKLSHHQIEQFKEIRKLHLEASQTLPKFHLLNSSGVFNYPELQFDMVRCGIAFHGYANRKEWDEQLKPVASLKSQICQIHHLSKGESVGYDHGWIAKEDCRIAILPIGHADGIGRHFGNQKSRVLIHGKKAPIVGNICMDLFMVDVTHIQCREGDEVTLFDAKNNANSFAQSGGTISYEILTALGSRIRRIVKD
ncbi:MAG: alanine racemase [Flavobacteriaceae bacterium]